MKIKKVIAVIAGIAVTLSAAVGGVYGYKSYQDKKLIAEVQPVSNLNWGYWGDTETSYGTVTNDSSQEIYLDDSRMIKEVYVEKGDAVQKGDPLLAYDTAELQIEIERKKLDISTIENNIERQKYKYEMLKTQTPVKKDPPKLNEEQLAWYQHMDEENRLTETDKNDGRIYNYRGNWCIRRERRKNRIFIMSTRMHTPMAAFSMPSVLTRRGAAENMCA